MPSFQESMRRRRYDDPDETGFKAPYTFENDESWVSPEEGVEIRASDLGRLAMEEPRRRDTLPARPGPMPNVSAPGNLFDAIRAATIKARTGDDLQTIYADTEDPRDRFDFNAGPGALQNIRTRSYRGDSGATGELDYLARNPAVAAMRFPDEFQPPPEQDPMESMLTDLAKRGDRSAIGALQRYKTGQANTEARTGLGNAAEQGRNTRAENALKAKSGQFTIAQDLKERMFQALAANRAGKLEDADLDRVFNQFIARGQLAVSQQNAATSAANTADRAKFNKSRMALNAAREKQIESDMKRADLDPMRKLELDNVRQLFQNARTLANADDAEAPQAMREAEAAYKEARAGLASQGAPAPQAVPGYDSMPPGTEYVGPDGKKRRKGG